MNSSLTFTSKEIPCLTGNYYWKHMGVIPQPINFCTDEYRTLNSPGMSIHAGNSQIDLPNEPIMVCYLFVILFALSFSSMLSLFVCRLNMPWSSSYIKFPKVHSFPIGKEIIHR